VTALLALALAAAQGCPEALARAAATPDDALAARAPALVEELEEAGAGGPTAALAAAARALAATGTDPAHDLPAASFRGALARHCALAAAPALPPASTAERETLAAILARPELSRSRSDPYALRRALERLWEWLVALLGTSEAERYASLGRALFLGVAVGALVLAGSALRRRRREGRGADPERGEPAAPGVAPDESAARAEEALRRGDGRGAVRFALLAALGALERAGRVPRGRALTNGELLEALAPTPTATLSSELALVVRAFDRAVYGGQPVGDGEARSAVEASRRIAVATGGAQ
jgi:hypothetical protein